MNDKPSVPDDRSVSRAENRCEKSDTGSFFDGYVADWDNFYKTQADSGRAFDYRNRQRILVEILTRRLGPGSRLLEFGCGAGHTAVQLSQLGYDLTCLDISPGMAEATRRSYAQANLKAEIGVGTVHDLREPSQRFDAVFALGVMEYVPDHAATLRRVHELLKPGGLCVLSFTNADSPCFRVEAPLKYVTARALHLFTRDPRYLNIAYTKGRLHRSPDVSALYEQSGFQVEDVQFFSYGIRLSSCWLPPLFIVRRLDSRLKDSRLKSWGRGFMTVGYKPQP